MPAEPTPNMTTIIAVENDYESLVQRVTNMVFEEDSGLWRNAAEVVERIAPGISPYDRRHAIDEILAPIRQVIADELW